MEVLNKMPGAGCVCGGRGGAQLQAKTFVLVCSGCHSQTLGASNHRKVRPRSFGGWKSVISGPAWLDSSARSLPGWQSPAFSL